MTWRTGRVASLWFVDPVSLPQIRQWNQWPDLPGSCNKRLICSHTPMPPLPTRRMPSLSLSLFLWPNQWQRVACKNAQNGFPLPTKEKLQDAPSVVWVDCLVGKLPMYGCVR